MTITLPITDDRDRLGKTLYQQLIAADLPDLACECAFVVRAARDTAQAFEQVLLLTRDAPITFAWEVQR